MPTACIFCHGSSLPSTQLRPQILDEYAVEFIYPLIRSNTGDECILQSSEKPPSLIPLLHSKSRVLASSKYWTEISGIHLSINLAFFHAERVKSHSFRCSHSLASKIESCALLNRYVICYFCLKGLKRVYCVAEIIN